MFEVPSRPDIKRCVITEQSIQDGVEPLLLTEEPRHVDAEGGEAAVADKTAERRRPGRPARRQLRCSLGHAPQCAPSLRCSLP
jgi:hypothetical protein